MKKLSIILMSIAVLAFASCSSLQNAASSNTVAQASGQQCAMAASSLYQSYKSTGKLDITSGSNLTNALALITCYNQLKQNKGNADYRKAFTSGAISAGTSLITSANAEQFTNALLNATGLDNVNMQNISQKVETASTIITLLNALKQ